MALCVQEAQEHLASLGLDGEVVVCDNGSEDGSAVAAAGAGAFVVNEAHRGYGAAVSSGINAAHGHFVVMADADGSYDLAALEPMLARLRDGADLVMGNRFRGHIAPGAMPWLNRHVGSPILSSLLNLFFGARVGDVHSGIRAFTRQTYERMALQTTGMEFASEMVARAARLGLRIEEVPVNYRPRTGRSKLRRYRDGWRHLRFLLMYSPTWLYLAPSALLGTLSLSVLAALAVSPIEFAGRTWDMHLAAVASLLTVLAIQVAWLGISARTLAVVHGFDPGDALLSGFYRRFKLEVALALAAVLVVAGGSIAAWVVWGWVAAGFPPLDGIRRLLLGSTLIIIGVQSAFNAFFLSLVGVETRAMGVDHRDPSRFSNGRAHVR